MKQSIVTISLALLWGAFADPAAGQELTVDQVVARSNQVAYYQGKDGRANVTMTITDEQGRQRTREFTILRRDEPDPSGKGDDSYCGDQKMYVYFQRPADVNKMVFLVWKQPGKDDDRWLYLPALDLVKRIAASDKRTSFVGSNFYYEDVSGRSTEDDHHELIEVSDHYYVLKNTPKDAAFVEFSYYKMWIHKDTFIPIKAEYYDKNGKLQRVYQVTKVEKIGGYQTVVQSQMSNQQTGGTTVLDYADVAYDLGLPDDLFSERYLRRRPREWLR